MVTNPKKGKDKRMKITVIGRQMNVYSDMKDLIERKVAKFDKYFGGAGEATVTLSSKRNERNLEITINAANTLFRSEAGAETFHNALDLAIEALERQIRKNKTKIERRFRSSGLNFNDDASWGEDDFEETDGKVIRTKTYPIKPMSPEEAVLQMDLLGHQFYVFNNSETNSTCVVYLRKDGTYGLIIPEQ